jgi:TonB family protein
MRLHDYPARLRRGAAPADERTSFFCVGFASIAHAAILLLFVTWAKPPLEVALPGGSSGSKQPRAQLVRLSPLRTFPPAEAQPPEPEKTRPKPALVKRYTPGAPIVPKQERGAQKKSTSEETRATRAEVSPTAAADRAQRWWSPDSSSSVGVRTDGDFRWAYYLAAIRNKIGAAWVPPPGLGGRRVHASVYFRISKEGEVSVARVEDGSGNAFFDQTAMRALLAVGRMPPLPAGYNGEWLGVHFGFEYEQ